MDEGEEVVKKRKKKRGSLSTARFSSSQVSELTWINNTKENLVKK